MAGEGTVGTHAAAAAWGETIATHMVGFSIVQSRATCQAPTQEYNNCMHKAWAPSLWS